NTINTTAKNIITLEDPVEYRLPIVNQSQVNQAAGLTFATGLRSILRQDPDVIMVGEIRDIETAQLAIQAALTGHQVFSSLHTNDAPSTITRLVDMGIEPYLVASTLLCAIGQRLVRALCPRCKKPYQAAPDEKKCFGIEPSRELTFHKPVGCKYCERIGYLGRTGLFELLTLDEEIRELIVEKKPSSTIRNAAIRKGMQTLRAIGFKKIIDGTTSVAEVMRVTLDEELS
ncbi:MAG: ATPase, T2SS/T4P/T4SS family, partial [Planctomycetota bacterium]